MNTTDPELDQLLETFARKVWDPQQSEFEYRIQENKYPKFRAAIQSWAAKQELRAVEKAQEKAVLLCVKVMTPHLSDKQMLAMIAQLQQELDKS